MNEFGGNTLIADTVHDKKKKKKSGSKEFGNGKKKKLGES